MTTPPKLTPRQREIVRLLADGLTYAQIGGQLRISASMVRLHVYAIATKVPGKGQPRDRVMAKLDALLA